MSQNPHIRTFTVAFTLLFLMFAMPERAMSQKTMKIEGQVFIKDGEKEVPNKMFYVVVKSSRAEKVKKKIDELKNKHKKNLYDAEKFLRIYCENKEITLKHTMPNGTFEESVMQDSSFVFFSSAFNSQIKSVQQIICNNGKVIFEDAHILINISTMPRFF